MLAIRDSPIITAQNSPKVEKKPIFDCLITQKPAKSDTEEPNKASPEAPPTAPIDSIGDEPPSISSRNLSTRWMTQSIPTPREIAAIETVTILSPKPAIPTIAYSHIITMNMGMVATAARVNAEDPQIMVSIIEIGATRIAVFVPNSR